MSDEFTTAQRTFTGVFGTNTTEYYYEYYTFCSLTLLLYSSNLPVLSTSLHLQYIYTATTYYITSTCECIVDRWCRERIIPQQFYFSFSCGVCVGWGTALQQQQYSVAVHREGGEAVGKSRETETRPSLQYRIYETELLPNSL